MRAILMVSLYCLTPHAFATTAGSTTTVQGVDVYRSQNLTAEGLKAAVGSQLEFFLKLRSENKRGAEKSIERAQAALLESLKALAGKPAYLNLSYQEYAAEGGGRRAFLTVDVVDAVDAGERMLFHNPPTEKLQDPGGALETWRRYTELGETLSREGKISIVDRPECGGLYCTWGAATPELANFERALVAAAADRKKDLLSVLTRDADPRKRAAALFVLSYSADGKAVVEAAQKALKDPAEETRGAALLVLTDVALYHKTFVLDAAAVIPVLDYPTVGDRSKALGLVSAMSANEGYKTYLAARAIAYLAALLRLEQPANHDLAHSTLQTLTNQTFGPRDYEAWDKWVADHASPPRNVTGVSAAKR